MQDLNQIIIEGRATRDPELTYTSGGTALAKFGIASNRSYKKGDEWQEETTFVDVAAWAKQAELCGQYVRKGMPVRVVGRLKFDSWEKDGQKHSRLTISADHVEWRTPRAEA
jgi:single-strand DNA-binding protein